MADKPKTDPALAQQVAAVFADNATPFDVDGVAKHLGLDRETVNEHAPWDHAELDASNSEVFELVLQGDPVVWAHRDDPAYYDEQGEPQPVVKPAFARVHLRARSLEEAKAAALATHPGFTKVAHAKTLSGE